MYLFKEHIKSTSYQIEFSKYLVNKYNYVFKKGTHLTTKNSVQNILAILIKLLSYRYKLEPQYSNVYIPLNTNVYTPQNKELYPELQKFNMKQVKIALSILIQKNIVTFKKGFFAYNEKIIDEKKIQEKIKSKCSCIKMNDPVNWNIDIEYEDRLKIISATDKEKNKCILKIKNEDGEVINKIDIIEEKLTNKLSYINKFLVKNNREDLQYNRSFINNTNSYGRVTNYFQSLPKKWRKDYCKIYDKIELDFNSFNILAFWLEATGDIIDFDPYIKICKKIGLPDSYRKMVKQTVLSVIGTKSKNSAKKTITSLLARDFGIYSSIKENAIKLENISLDTNILNKRKWIFNNYCKKNNLNIPHYLINTDMLLEVIEEVLDPIRNYFYKGLTSLCQNIESNTIIDIMVEMCENKDLPLSIHDSFLIPKKKEEYYDLYKNYALLKQISNYVNVEKKEKILKQINFIFNKILKLKMSNCLKNINSSCNMLITNISYYKLISNIFYNYNNIITNFKRLDIQNIYLLHDS